MTYDQLYNFTVVAELLNFTKAAEVLFISQPTLSRQIAMLEQELGAELFVRTKQKVSLTPMGKILLDDSMVLIQNFMQTKKHIQQITSGKTGNLTISCMDFLCPEIYNPISEFIMSHPSVLVEMYSQEMGLLADRVGSNKIDVSIGFSLELTNPQPQYQIMPLIQENFVALMNRRHPLANRKKISLEEAKHSRLFFLGHTKFPAVRSIWSRNGFDEMINASIIAPEDIRSILLQVKVTPDAMVLLPRSVCLLYIHSCAVADIEGLDSEYQILMAWHRENNSSILHQFIDDMKEAFRDGPLRRLSLDDCSGVLKL